MKKHIFNRLLVLGIGAMLFASCVEVGPPVNMGNNAALNDTTFVEATDDAPQQHLVLLEEFTGVRCVNCPRAHNTIATLQATYPGRILPIGIHTGFYSTPYAGRNDFRIPEGASLENLMGGAQGYPSGSINRKQFAEETRIIIADQKWSNYIGGELAVAPPVNVTLTKVGTVENAKQSIEVRVKLTEGIAGPLNLTMYVVEDGIVDHQLTPTGVDTAYVHKHVLRKCVTPYNGTLLAAPAYEKNRVFLYRFDVDIDAAWDLSNCKVVGFVHRIGEVPAVLQSGYTNLN
jgi:hypothetical protein